jgi:DNA-binding MarR family transcriptional regulator
MTVSPHTPVAPRTRAELAGDALALVPLIKRRIQAGIPAGLSEELGGVTQHQMEALHLLHLALAGGESGVGATMNELARKQGCALSTATALADRLLRQGLAERIADPDDRRVVRIAPTPRGEQLCARFAEAKRDIAVEAMSRLSDDEAATLIDLLRKILVVEAVSHD